MLSCPTASFVTNDALPPYIMMLVITNLANIPRSPTVTLKGRVIVDHFPAKATTQSRILHETYSSQAGQRLLHCRAKVRSGQRRATLLYLEIKLFPDFNFDDHKIQPEPRASRVRRQAAAAHHALKSSTCPCKTKDTLVAETQHNQHCG